jgi:hypothetical protein
MRLWWSAMRIEMKAALIGGAFLILSVILTAILTPLFDGLLGRDEPPVTTTTQPPTPTTAVPTTVVVTTTSRPNAAQACKALITALRTERHRMNALPAHVQVSGGHVIGYRSSFEDAYDAARKGQAALADAYADYALTDRDLPPDKETVPMGGPVQELGKSLGDLTGPTAKDRDEAYNALTDWAAKLDNTDDYVVKACA